MGKMGQIVSRAWGVEQSVIDDTPKITYVIGGELRVENHGGIAEVSENMLKFGCGLSIAGKNLRVDWIERDFAVVIGSVEEIGISQPTK